MNKTTSDELKQVAEFYSELRKLPEEKKQELYLISKGARLVTECNGAA